MIDPLNTGKLAKTALEVKATVGSAAVMDAALTNLASVKELDRTNEGRNRGAAEWENPRPDEHDRSGVRCSHRRIIDAYPNALTSFGNWGSSRPRHSVGECVRRRTRPPGRVGQKTGDILTTRTTDPMHADAILGGSGLQRTWGFSPPLAFFAIDLLDFLSVTPTITLTVGGGFNRAGTGEDGYFYRTLLPQRDLLWLPQPDSGG